MSIYLMLAIAALATFVGAGFVWFGWSALENFAAMRARRDKKPVSEPADL